MKIMTAIVATTIAVFCLLSAVPAARAQSDAVKNIYAYGATEPTNIAGVYIYPAPPQGFNPLTATDVELATHGFPARPDERTEANHYAAWKRAMQAAKIRWNGELRVRKSPEGGSFGSGEIPIATAQASARLGANPAVAGPTQLISTIWSGVATTNKLTKWSAKSSFADVFGMFTVPLMQPAFGGCASGGIQVISWIGLDINPDSRDMALGGGSSSSHTCTEIDTGYYAVIKLFDEGENLAFGIKPGDVMYVEVSDSLGGSAPGTVFVEDLTTLLYQSFSFAPTRPIIGNNAGWLVGSGTTFPSAQLGNTIATFFGNTVAYNGSRKAFFPGTSAPANHVFTMQDRHRTQNIEIVTSGSTGRMGKSGLQFETTGCAYVGGCAP